MQIVPRVPLDHPATYEDLVNAPEHLVAEILDGCLYTSPRPAPRHARACSALVASLMPAFDFGERSPGGWTILVEPEVHLRDDVVVPDIAGWRRQRLPRLPDSSWFPVAPDWVCEIVSPSTAPVDRTTKLAIYGREGVRHAWLVDPIACTLEVMAWHQGHWVTAATHTGQSVVRAAPFDTYDLDLSRVWT
jgi:Uma2 family endonuclease